MLAADNQGHFVNSGPVAAQETASIGNKAAARSEVLLTSNNAVATFIGVRWDGDKVRGIRVELSDGSSKQAGGYDDGGGALAQYRFAAGETLVSARLQNSGYGYGSVRHIAFETSDEEDFQRRGGGLRPRGLACGRGRGPGRIPRLGEFRQLHQRAGA